jgi:hypothetical protein
MARSQAQRRGYRIEFQVGGKGRPPRQDNRNDSPSRKDKWIAKVGRTRKGKDSHEGKAGILYRKDSPSRKGTVYRKGGATDY